MTAAFDTLAYTQKLRSAGISPEQAEALKAALAETVATKSDLQVAVADLRHEIELVRKDVQAMKNCIIIRITAVVVTTVAVTGTILGILTVLF